MGIGNLKNGGHREFREQWAYGIYETVGKGTLQSSGAV